MKYRKKPVVVEATQWFRNGDHPGDGDEVFPETSEFAGQRMEGKIVRYFRRPDMPGDTRCKHCNEPMHVHGWIDTLEGGHIVCPGDFVVTGVEGEVYPVKPDIFAKTYEPFEAWPLEPKDICPDCGHDGEHHMSDPERAEHDGCFHEVPDEATKLGHRRCGCQHQRAAR